MRRRSSRRKSDGRCSFEHGLSVVERENIAWRAFVALHRRRQACRLL